MRNDSAAMLERLVVRAGQLFSLPVVAIQVLELTNSPQVDNRAIKECIENDPALTGKILRVVNSSLFGLSREVSDLNQAIALLGSKPLKLLVLGFSLPNSLFASVESEILGHYWRHALTKAVAGREISETLWNLPGDEAFIAGLLQDLGLLLLIQQVGEPYVLLLKKVWAEGKDMAALETESMGFDHAELTTRLLGHWGLPAALVEAVGWDPQRQGAANAEKPAALSQIVYLAELVAQLLADNRPQVLPMLMQYGREYRQLTEEKLERLVDNLQNKVKQLADVLSLQLPEGTDYRDILLAAHGRLSAVAAETVEDMLTAQVNASAAQEDNLLAEVSGLSKAISGLAAKPKEKLSPAAVAAGSAMRPAGGGESPSPAPGFTRTALESAQTSSSTGAPTETAAADALMAKLASAVASCRISRCALSVVLVEFDRVDDLIAARGIEGFQRLMKALRNACGAAGHPGTVCLPHGEAGFALILPDCERRKAVEIGGDLLHAISRAAPLGATPGARAASLSVGVGTVAMPPKNFPPRDLFATASRCLYGSHASGGGVLKSLEIY
ncbi:MAG: HDOD domain-containing protein [Pirellulales bacterium]|nr:HDOD domain-containing protein [Pirellulales bacterium]